MKKIGIVGAGAMGSGIGQVAAMAGDEVILYDSFPGAVAKARESIFSSLNKLVAKNKINDLDAKSIFGRIYFVDSLQSIEKCHLVIEAIIEDESAKKEIFEKIESYVSTETIIASNTSSLSITGLAGTLKNPCRFIGIHFFNPPVLMKLVEIIPALQTSQDVFEYVVDMIRSWDKTIVVAKDTPGFIVNRIARPYYGEALRIAEEQLASPKDIDAAMKNTGGFKMGPFELMDFIGNDVNEAVTRSVWTAMHFDPRYKPSTLQSNMVRAGWLGKKTGKGFYDYTSGADSTLPAASISPEEISARIIAMLINEAADAYYLGIASRDDIDMAMTLGVNYPKGLLKWADEIGLSACVERMDALHHIYKEERYRCSAGLRKMASSELAFY